MAFRRISYTNGDPLINENWAYYFSESSEGGRYEILYEDTANTLINTNSDLVLNKYQDFYNSLSPGLSVLLIGYGIGNPVDTIAANECTLTIMEKYQEVIDLATQDLSPYTVQVTDPYTFNYAGEPGAYDIILWDFLDYQNTSTTLPLKEMEFALRDGGQIVAWSAGGTNEVRSIQAIQATEVMNDLNGQNFFRSFSKNANTIYNRIKTKLKQKG